MAQPLAISVQPRTLTGRKVKSLRRDHLIPANVYGAKIKSFAVQLPELSFQKAYERVGETGLLNLKVEGSSKSHPVLITSLQRHPLSGQVLHVDFREVLLTEKVTATIEVELVGESPAVKDFSANLVTALNSLEVEALPTDLPDKFVVDISSLKAIGDSILVKDLTFDRSKVALSVDPEETVVTVKPQEEEKVEEAPAPEDVETAPAEGETETKESTETPKDDAKTEPAPEKS